jgi:hypothetical protein
MVKCNSYKYRPAGQSLGPVHPAMGSDGLYPGQIKAPIDYSDTDPVESVGEELFKMEQALDVPFKDRHYNSVKPEECDT